MKVVIESLFYVRGNPITSYHSFPQYTDKIEQTMSSQLDFLNQYDKFSLTMKVSKNEH